MLAGACTLASVDYFSLARMTFTLAFRVPTPPQTELPALRMPARATLWGHRFPRRHLERIARAAKHAAPVVA